MSVTIVSGLYGGRRLDCPPGKAVRPMTARVKGAVFNILGASVEGTRVLDLYAGSGGFGIEALSRGADDCVFVEREEAHAKVLRANLVKLGIQARVFESPNEKAFQRLAGESFDLVLMDPPFAEHPRALPLEVTADLQGLAASGIWKGTLVLEHRRGKPEYPAGLVPYDLRDYGGASVAFFRAP